MDDGNNFQTGSADQRILQQYSGTSEEGAEQFLNADAHVLARLRWFKYFVRQCCDGYILYSAPERDRCLFQIPAADGHPWKSKHDERGSYE